MVLLVGYTVTSLRGPQGLRLATPLSLDNCPAGEAYFFTFLFFYFMEISRDNKEQRPVYNATVHYVGPSNDPKPYVIFGNGDSITVFGDVNYKYTIEDCIAMYSTAADIAIKNAIKVVIFNPTFS